MSIGGKPAIRAPIVGGSGAIVVHRALEAALPDYRVEALSPYWGLAPPALALRRRAAAAVTHTLPELGSRVAHPASELVLTFHNYYLDADAMAGASRSQRFFYRNVMAPAMRGSLRRAKWVTAVSRFTADLVERRHALGERLVLIRNGVDTALFSPSARVPDDRVRILFAGNPTRRKGADHLAALARALPEGVVMRVTSGLRGAAAGGDDESRRRSGYVPGLGPRFRGNDGGVAVGNDGDAGRGDDSAKRTGRIETIPRREHAEMPAVYADADILIFPTRREGFGLVAAEAMACGLPVVATNCSSLPELVEHGKGGFLFEPDNRAEMLEYLLRLAGDPVMRAEMGAFNREKVLAEFPLEKMVSGYRELFAV